MNMIDLADLGASKELIETKHLCSVISLQEFSSLSEILLFSKKYSAPWSKILIRLIRGLLEKYPTVFFYANTWWIII